MSNVSFFLKKHYADGNKVFPIFECKTNLI